MRPLYRNFLTANVSSEPKAVRAKKDKTLPDARPLYTALLQRFTISNPFFKREKLIPFENVVIPDWPVDVVFYNHWTPEDEQKVMQTIGLIVFWPEYRTFEPVTEEQRKGLYQRLEAVSIALNGKSEIPWARYFNTPDFKHLHLTSPDPALWCARDTFIVRKLLAYYENDEEEVKKLKRQERAIDIVACLTKKFNNYFLDWKLKLDWSKLDVIGWPKNVSFNSAKWTVCDMRILESKMQDIRFTFPSAKLDASQPSSNVSNFVSSSLNNLEKNSSSSSSVDHRPDKIQKTSEITSAAPSIKINQNNLYNFTNLDTVKPTQQTRAKFYDLTDVATVLLTRQNQENFHDLTNDETSQPMEQVEATTQQPDSSTAEWIKDQFMEKFTKFWPELAIIGSLDYEFVEPRGWPQSVAFYNPAYWTTDDLLHLSRAVNRITFVQDWRRFQSIPREKREDLLFQLKVALLPRPVAGTLWVEVVKHHFPDFHRV